MKILAIETSCDDTGITTLKISGDKKAPDFEILSNIVSSQIKIHKKYGGVYPALAKREHQKNLVPVLMRALKQAKLLNPKSQIPMTKKIPNPNDQKLKSILERELELYKKIISFLQKYEKPDIDLIAVTNGPGLEPCLWVGVNFAKALSYFWNIPIVPINHIEAHILVNFLNKKLTSNPVHKLRYRVIYEPTHFLFPAICLVVSGGHTQLILMKKIGKYEILGETRDDAAGECFDKCAKILDLGYPGGPIIAKLSAVIAGVKHPLISGCPTPVKLPRPMINTKDYDFSFSGLKTAVLYKWQKIKATLNSSDRLGKELIQKQMATEIQQAIIDVLLKKTIKATKDYNAKITTTKSSRIRDKIGTIILGGGVSANSELRKQLKEKIQKELPDTKYLIPDSALSTDNALMTAITGYFHRNKKISCDIGYRTIKADANLRIE